MSKKTLLNEATVRRFMKLADMGTLTDTFINEGGYGVPYQDDEPEGEDEELDLPDEGEVPEAPEDMGPEEPVPEEEPELEAEEADEIEISEEDRDVLRAAAPILMKISGEDAGEGADLGMDEPMPDMGEPDMGEEEEEALMQEVARRVAHRLRKEGMHANEEEMEEGKEEEMEEGKEALDEVEVVDENELVQEVTRRVAARLRAAMKSRK